MAESKEELKSLLMKVKEESEKAEKEIETRWQATTKRILALSFRNMSLSTPKKLKMIRARVVNFEYLKEKAKHLRTCET